MLPGMNTPESSPAPVTARTRNGEMSLERTGSTSLRLNVKYRVLERKAWIVDGVVQESVNALCEAEIESVRQLLAELGEELADQLSDEGSEPRLHRQYEDDDERAWNRKGNVFTVRGSVYESEEVINHSEEVSETALIQETVRLMIRQREEAIRNVYRDILTGVDVGDS
jgi:hypothetical protein